MNTLYIDDAMWGFPLGGTVVGACLSSPGVPDVFEFRIVDIKFFKPPLFKAKKYLPEVSRKGFEIIKKLGVTPDNCRIEICRGYVNTILASDLGACGYDIMVTKIEGALQNQIEQFSKDYIRTLINSDRYYDPKDLKPSDICKSYYATVNWALKNNRIDLMKTGWGKLKQYE